MSECEEVRAVAALTPYMAAQVGQPLTWWRLLLAGLPGVGDGHGVGLAPGVPSLTVVGLQLLAFSGGCKLRSCALQAGELRHQAFLQRNLR